MSNIIKINADEVWQLMQMAGTFLAYVTIINFSHMLKLKLTNLTAEIGHRRLIFQLSLSDCEILVP